MLVLTQDPATVTVTRLQRASPPLRGTFSVEIFGQVVKGQIILSGSFLKGLTVGLLCFTA